MADSPATVALNIGAQSISAAVFETSKRGGLILRAYDVEAISSDPALDSSRIAQVRVAIADLRKRMKLSDMKVRYAISGSSVFSRFVKLPPMQEDNIEQLVVFEAQQHVPFPLDEVVWDYELIPGANGEKEAVIVAIKSDALDEVNTAVNDSGLATAEVDVAPLALYNAYRASYPEIAESVLLIDVGAKATNLLYIEGKRFFTRSIPFGGAGVTSAIAKEYAIPFADAEHQKVSNGLVALAGGHTEQLEETVASLATVIRNSLTRLPGDIVRTTNHYRSQHGGTAPERVVLAGGGANLPYVLEFFREKLNLPVEFFNPLNNISIGKNVDTSVLERSAHTMGELVGLGLRGSGMSTLNIDLVPAVVEQSRATERRKPYLIAAAAVFLAGLGLWAALQNMAASKAANEGKKMQSAQEVLSPVSADIKKLQIIEDKLHTVASGYTTAEADHAFWYDLLAEVRGAFASEAAWVVDMEPLVGYNPAVGNDSKELKPTVKKEFPSTPYGSSALSDPDVEATTAKKPPTGQGTPPGAVANAVHFRGFWRENAKSQDLVNVLVQRLREHSRIFKFTYQDAKGKEVQIPDGKIYRASIEGPPGDLAHSFDITVPLVRGVPIK